MAPFSAEIIVSSNKPGYPHMLLAAVWWHSWGVLTLIFGSSLATPNLSCLLVRKREQLALLLARSYRYR